MSNTVSIAKQVTPPSGTSKAFSVAMGVSQSIAQGGLHDVVYDTVLVDTENAYSLGVYTIPETGNWEFNISAVFNAASGFTACDIFINSNSGTYLVHGQPCVSVSDPTAVTVNAGGIFPLTAGDTVKISVFGITVGGVNFNCSGFANGYYNTFIGILI